MFAWMRRRLMRAFGPSVGAGNDSPAVVFFAKDRGRVLFGEDRGRVMLGQDRGRVMEGEDQGRVFRGADRGTFS